MLDAVMTKNDRKAFWLIGTFSVIVFAAVVALGQITLDVALPFNVHLFARVNAVINSAVAVLLIVALWAVKGGKYLVHKRSMLAAMVLSVAFLLSYIAHHLLSGSTPYGGQGISRLIYFIILVTHIFLAAIILPFILFTAYRALVAEWPAHRKLAKITWPIWFYVAVTGVVVYLMIAPYYQ
jgi:putative membrane protein